MSFGVATGMIITQYIEALNEKEPVYDTMALAVLCLHAACAFLVIWEALISELGGKQWWYSTFVIATGFLGTMLQTAYVGGLFFDAHAQEQETFILNWAIGTLASQVFANSIMLSLIFSVVAAEEESLAKDVTYLFG